MLLLSILTLLGAILIFGLAEAMNHCDIALKYKIGLVDVSFVFLYKSISSYLYAFFFYCFLITSFWFPFFVLYEIYLF